MTTVPPKLWKSKISPDIAKCHLQGNCPLLRIIVWKVNVYNYVLLLFKIHDAYRCAYGFNHLVLCVKIRVLKEQNAQVSRTCFNLCRYSKVVRFYLSPPCGGLALNGCRFASSCSMNIQQNSYQWFQLSALGTASS